MIWRSTEIISLLISFPFPVDFFPRCSLLKPSSYAFQLICYTLAKPMFLNLFFLNYYQYPGIFLDIFLIILHEILMPQVLYILNIYYFTIPVFVLYAQQEEDFFLSQRINFHTLSNVITSIENACTRELH